MMQETTEVTPQPLEWENWSRSSITTFRHPLSVTFQLRVFKKPYSNNWTFRLGLASGEILYTSQDWARSRSQAMLEAENWWETFRKGFALSDQQAAAVEGGAA